MSRRDDTRPHHEGTLSAKCPVGGGSPGDVNFYYLGNKTREAPRRLRVAGLSLPPCQSSSRQLPRSLLKFFNSFASFIVLFNTKKTCDRCFVAEEYLFQFSTPDTYDALGSLVIDKILELGKSFKNGFNSHI